MPPQHADTHILTTRGAGENQFGLVHFLYHLTQQVHCPPHTAPLLTAERTNDDRLRTPNGDGIKLNRGVITWNDGGA